MQLNPYLNFNGQCETAFKFYEQCFGGRMVAMSAFEGSPMENEVPPAWRKKILHARLQVGAVLLMGGDELPEDYEVPKGFNVTLGLDDPADAERIFGALAESGTVPHAAAGNLLGGALWHGDRPLWHSVDD